MNINTFLIVLLILLLHYMFDFILQSHWMASNKSRTNKALYIHVEVYSIGLVLMALVVWFAGRISPVNACMWVAVNANLHWCTDYITSRKSSKLFNVNWHDFFVVIGGDQLIHYVTLFGTLTYLSGQQ